MLEADFKEVFISELVDNFYKSFRRRLSLTLKNSRTLFASLKSIVSQSIESVRDARGVSEAASLEEMVNSLERDVDEWCRLNQLDLTSLIEEELDRLAEQI